MATKHVSHAQVTPAVEHTQMILDGHKLGWHNDRVEAWKRGERIAPVTIDLALSRSCNFSCWFCYAQLQENDRQTITADVMRNFLDDSARMGVRGISLVSDGESTLSPAYEFTVTYGASLGISMASGTNGYAFTRDKLEKVLPSLTYLRFNFSGGEPKRYAEIMGVKEEAFHKVVRNISDAVDIKRALGLPVTLGLQMVYEPRDVDQVMPLARLGAELGVDYTVFKHCSDDEYGNLGVQYDKYAATYPTLRQAEALSTDRYKVVIKWSKIADEGKRSYQQCYGPPFLIQVSGSGLVAPCGMLFNDRYAKFHIGNICEQRWWDIWQSDRYWEVMRYLGSDQFNAQKMCGSLCLQHMVNTALDRHIKQTAIISPSVTGAPLHVNFV